MPAETSLPATDARILAIAADHVRRHGFGRTTVVSVAEAAGMTHANIYRYFPSKLALGDAVTAEWLKPIELMLATVADAPDPADDKLERMILALAGAQRDKLEADPFLFDLFAAAHEASRGVARKHRARVRGLLDRVIEEGLASGIFTIRRRERAAALVQDAVFRFMTPAAIRADRDIPRRVLDDRLAAVTAMLIRSLKAGTV